ncbi:MAG: hypothetical protein ABI999_08710 [Acidobacteriota bacterium]
MRIWEDICRDKDRIVKANPVGSDEEILLWMLLGTLLSYLSLSELEMPCFKEKPDAETYRKAILFVLKGRKANPFDAESYLADMNL